MNGLYWRTLNSTCVLFLIKCIACLIKVVDRASEGPVFYLLVRTLSECRPKQYRSNASNDRHIVVRYQDTNTDPSQSYTFVRLHINSIQFQVASVGYYFEVQSNIEKRV